MPPIKAKGYAAKEALLDRLSRLSRIDFEREEPKDDQVLIDILYCGVCHSDLHQVRNDWGNTVYPCLPGHEIIGKVVTKGKAVTKFEIGDTVGVGCMIDSCGQCGSCREGLEQYCEGPKSWTATYNGPMKPDGTNTFGGYSTSIVVKESFVLKIPQTLDIKATAPILCAGITTYSPLKFWKVKEGSKVAIVGLGGLGHMGVMLATAMGAQVTVITTSEEKRQEAQALGAKEVLVSEDSDAMSKHELAFDLILITIPDKFDVTPYISLLKRDGALVTVGLLGPYKNPLNNMELAMHRRTVAGSIIGGIQETQEVLEFCAQHSILPQVELIPIQDINQAFERMKKEEVRFRYVIDMQSLKKEQ
ncbi:NAD(P)-dependent alcohol dehydrogenase [Rhodocytophaga aerolata]|uniref:NAD(P)-dependent alcohol dehydrogenase n=1 Tax=Rhodocytophaga aerolata TaxID=455078 RepID=A0ABT8RI58_9BACT|nr:NAD(P)-dependent alcohol dehydrogenase [Rhodocytophaga aerolata]MDO1451784.1 NAD(P)-dependent alcohol dehydrogenase [Rhodocytophaga aerolata]